MSATHTYAILEVSRETFEEIREKLQKAGYQHLISQHLISENVTGGATIDMYGLALRAETDTQRAIRDAIENSPELLAKIAEDEEGRTEVHYGSEITYDGPAAKPEVTFREKEPMTAEQYSEKHGLPEPDRDMKLTRSETLRGFAVYNFVDRYGEPCSLQKSSLATEDAIWLGCEKNRVPHLGEELSPRMQLTQDMVRELLPLLQHFAETGELPEGDQ